MNANERIINNINLLKYENTQLKNEFNQLKNDNALFKNNNFQLPLKWDAFSMRGFPLKKFYLQ